MTIKLSIIVVAYNMARELPRTIQSLCVPYQRQISPDDYEIIIVDNGSKTPFDRKVCSPPGMQVRIIDQPDPNASPARAVNTGVEASQGDIVCIMIDGARMASPGLLASALSACRSSARNVVGVISHHLGPDEQSRAMTSGYSSDLEDELLASIDWQNNGYGLFDISWFDGSSAKGVFGPIAESNALFMSRRAWEELGGMDERFKLPGGGLCNLDLFKRAAELPDSSLIMLLGEATFHQIHGGVSTNAETSQWDAFSQEYESIKQEPYRLPVIDPIYQGKVRPAAFSAIAYSARLASNAALPRPVTAQSGPEGTALPEPLLNSIQMGCLGTRYRGVELLKSPFDLALYTHLIDRLRPQTVIEVGVREGGSLLWFSDMLRAQSISGEIVGIDIEVPELFKRPRKSAADKRIKFFQGKAAELEVVLTPEFLAGLPRPWLVVEDSSHFYEDSLAVLRFFDSYLAAGDYIVIEDGIVRSLANPLYATYDNGPTRAIDTFMRDRARAYEIDRSLCDYYGLNVTWNPNGWIRKL